MGIKDEQKRKYVILDKLSNGYSMHTEVETLFKACKVNTLSHIPEMDKDDLNYARHEFEQYSYDDKVHFIENVYDYRLLDPTPLNVRGWENFHSEKWAHAIEKEGINEAEITYAKDTNCLMVTEKDELVSVKFYNEKTEVPQSKEEERHFLKVLEKDAMTMMKEEHFSQATLDLQAFGEGKQVLSGGKESYMRNKNNSNELEM